MCAVIWIYSIPWIWTTGEQPLQQHEPTTRTGAQQRHNQQRHDQQRHDQQRHDQQRHDQQHDKQHEWRWKAHPPTSAWGQRYIFIINLNLISRTIWYKIDLW